MRHLWEKVFGVGIFLVFLLSFEACDNTMDPLIDDEALYTIYGYLEVGRSENYIRIKNLKIPLVKDSAGTINGKVILTNLDTGASQILRDSVITFNGKVTHNYKSTLNILPKSTYQLDLIIDKGKTITARANTPGNTDMTVFPKGQDCVTPITFSFKPVMLGTYVYMKIKFSLNGSKEFIRVLVPSKLGFDGEVTYAISPQNILKTMFCGEFYANCNIPPPPPNGPGGCYLLGSDKLTVQYFYGFIEDREDNIDNIRLPGGIGSFIGVDINSETFKIDTRRLD